MFPFNGVVVGRLVGGCDCGRCLLTWFVCVGLIGCLVVLLVGLLVCSIVHLQLVFVAYCVVCCLQLVAVGWLSFLIIFVVNGCCCLY